MPIGPEWTEIHCPDTIAAMAPFQRLYLMIPVGSDVPNFHDKVIVFNDGKRVAIDAEIIDTEGRVYPLNRWRAGTEIRGRDQTGPDRRFYPYLPLTSKDLPLSLRFNTVRLRSSSPIVLQDILWSSSNLSE